VIQVRDFLISSGKNGFVLACCLLSLPSIGCVERVSTVKNQFEAVRNQSAIDQIADVNLGKLNDLVLYDTVKTDSLLRTVKVVENVRRIDLEMTDIRQEGFRIIASFPSLRALSIYGGSNRLDDVSWEVISSIDALEELHLKNVAIDKARLTKFLQSGRLQRLSIFDDVSEKSLRLRAKDFEGCLESLTEYDINGELKKPLN